MEEMMKSRRTLRIENAEELLQMGIGFPDTRRLQQIARSLHRSYENACNYGLTERQERREERLEQEARDLLHSHNLPCVIQGDPRGWPIVITEHENETFSAPRVCPF